MQKLLKWFLNSKNFYHYKLKWTKVKKKNEIINHKMNNYVPIITNIKKAKLIKKNLDFK
jgi:hypothetical protein